MLTFVLVISFCERVCAWKENGAREGQRLRIYLTRKKWQHLLWIIIMIIIKIKFPCIPKIMLGLTSMFSTFSGLMLEGHCRVDLPCVHAHPAAWVGQGRTLWLPVMVARGHVASCWPTVHPILVGWRVGTRRDITGQCRGRLQETR